MDILVAVEGADVLGTVGLTADGWVLGLFVDPIHQRKGIGGKLLAAAEKLARKRGFGCLRSHVAVNSVDFYKKCGFRVVKKVDSKEFGKTYRVVKRI